MLQFTWPWSPPSEPSRYCTALILVSSLTLLPSTTWSRGDKAGTAGQTVERHVLLSGWRKCSTSGSENSLRSSDVLFSHTKDLCCACLALLCTNLYNSCKFKKKKFLLCFSWFLVPGCFHLNSWLLKFNVWILPRRWTQKSCQKNEYPDKKFHDTFCFFF